MRKIIKALLNPRKAKLSPDKQVLRGSLDRNISLFKKEIFAGDDTVVYRLFSTNNPNSLRCAVIFIDQMIDRESLMKHVIRPLMKKSIDATQLAGSIDYIVDSVITIDGANVENSLGKIVPNILQGESLLLIDGYSTGVILNTRGWAMRAVEEPQSESVVRGPREGFTEGIMLNLTLLRRKLKTPKLRFHLTKLGQQTKTTVAIAYIDGLASPEILKELNRRLNNTQIDGVLESGYIEEMIKDSPLSPFKTVGHTERPDIIAGKLLEGRIAIFCDGTPFVLTVPFIFQELFQANEDYYKNFLLASFDRIVRYMAFFITTSTPAIYLSLITYHQEMVPTPLLLSISAARDGVPFPTVFEVIAMGLVFEILREGGIRLPTPIGQALSIVGAIVLGDAAATAQLVSAPMIIVIALTAISSFAIPQMLGLTVIIRLIFVIIASFLGLYGYIFAVIGLVLQLTSMRSFGIPYMANMGSLHPQDVKDTMIRAPWWVMYWRPKFLANRNMVRQRKEANR